MESVGRELEDRDVLLREVRLKLAHAQNRMKQVYDKGHKESEFQLGDMVYVSLHSYRQQLVERRMNMKLSAKYYGPYKVIGKLGEVAYKLEFPQGSKIQAGVFHVSLLKKQVGPIAIPSTKLPDFPQVGRDVVPQALLDSKGKEHNRKVLIHWQGYNPADATWQQFPEFALEDKDVF